MHLIVLVFFATELFFYFLIYTEQIEGRGKSPYVEVDNFVAQLVASNGKSGSVRRWTYFPPAEIISFDIVGYRFCSNIHRQHRSNNIRLVGYKLFHSQSYQFLFHLIIRKYF
jgi:hypothetical protein